LARIEVIVLINVFTVDPAPHPFFEEALLIAKFEPGMYEVVRTFAPADT
jgi:hypothetical protein